MVSLLACELVRRGHEHTAGPVQAPFSKTQKVDSYEQTYLSPLLSALLETDALTNLLAWVAF